ncbi:hypothetical protein GCM10011594_38560 [Nakamurella endophytica]|uniref:Amidohydrolase-related domain-containing protein n=1 Tax=Nakamurella endophytica TaxID=1748367 RepID=A0A917WM97_9ACTN|nr:hypothetical protein GCM10011594_38560 [Nakamurella endophytica]
MTSLTWPSLPSTRAAVAFDTRAADATSLTVTAPDSEPTTPRPHRPTEHETGRSGTADAPLTSGPQAPRSGVLRAGYDADVIAVTADPVRDISVLSTPANIAQVRKGGQAQKQPALPVGETGWRRCRRPARTAAALTRRGAPGPAVPRRRPGGAARVRAAARCAR